MNECRGCGYWDSDYEGCSCPSIDMFYACPIESEKPENQKELEEYGKWLQEQREKKNDTSNY